jgi:hypothetical protein
VEVAGAGTRLPAKRLRAKVQETIGLRGRQTHPAGVHRRRRAVNSRRRLRDPPAEQDLPQKLPS